MCRWLTYLGEPVWLSELLTEPDHSLIRQSYKSQLRSEPLNGDGFGVVWYPTEFRSQPGRLRLPQPAWNNLNLLDIVRATRSHLVLAHVRAATVGLGVAEPNCHPFVSDSLSFMHNGTIASFHKLRRKLLRGLSDESFHSIGGTTDTEHLFALFQDRYRSQDGSGARKLADALRAAIFEVLELVEEVGGEHSTTLNLAVADGESAACSRVVHGEEPADSLFYRKGSRFLCEGGVCRVRDDGPHLVSIVASEPLSDIDAWEEVPVNSLALLERGRPIVLEPLELPGQAGRR